MVEVMTIDTLTITHVDGETISASKHTSQTEKVNEIIEVVNTHDDLYFTNDSLHWQTSLWIDGDDRLIGTQKWSGDGSAKYVISDLDSTYKFLTSILILEDLTGGDAGTLRRIQLFSDSYLSSPLAYDISTDTNPLNRIVVTGNKIYWHFNLGLYKVPANELLLRIYNDHTTESLKIGSVHLAGYATA